MVRDPGQRRSVLAPVVPACIYTCCSSSSSSKLAGLRQPSPARNTVQHGFVELYLCIVADQSLLREHSCSLFLSPSPSLSLSIYLSSPPSRPPSVLYQVVGFVKLYLRIRIAGQYVASETWIIFLSLLLSLSPSPSSPPSIPPSLSLSLWRLVRYSDSPPPRRVVPMVG